MINHAICNSPSSFCPNEPTKTLILFVNLRCKQYFCKCLPTRDEGFLISRVHCVEIHRSNPSFHCVQNLSSVGFSHSPEFNSKSSLSPQIKSANSSLVLMLSIILSKSISHLFTNPTNTNYRTVIWCSHLPSNFLPVELRCQAIAASPCGLPPFIERRLPRCGYFEAQSHGLYARCLRFAAPVTQSPRKTRFRSVANLYRTGFIPAGFLTPFRDGLRRQSQATKLCLAHINLPLLEHFLP